MRLSVVELTPRGTGAVSVLRIRGPDAAAAVKGLCRGSDPAPGPPRRVDLVLDGEDLDEALVCVLPSGDLELHVHGSRALVRRLLTHLGGAGEAGIPARSIEAAAAEAVALAPCEAAARILLDQAEGALAGELRALALATPDRRDRAIDALLSRWSAARWALEPAEVVIVGPVNAGKSTLFNALLGEARAIVDPEPGTTRDRLRARAQLGEWPVWISDTAGERDLASAPADTSVESEGQERARRAAAGADLVLRIERADLAPPAVLRPGRDVIVRTFADLLEPGSRTAGALSALRYPAEARRRVAEIFRSFFALPAEAWIPGAGVPLSHAQADAISALRGRTGIELQRAVEDLLASGGGLPRPGSIAAGTAIS